MRERRVRMPDGHHFAVTWSIPDEFGGMTEAMFRRSRAFDRLGGVAVEVLTFDDRPDYPSVQAKLRARGVLSDGVSITNLYDWLREHPISLREHPKSLREHPTSERRLGGEADAHVPLGEAPGVEVRTRDGRAVSRVRRDPDGRVLQIDHLRTDGTIVLSDRRDVCRDGIVGGRRVVLNDGSGRPVRSWSRIWDLYAAWLDELTAGERSFMIVDSKTTARFMAQYRRPHVVTAHVVHGSHRGEFGTLRASRREVLTHPMGFDILAVLSPHQAADLRSQLGALPNLAVVRNGRGNHRRPARITTRDRARGVVVAGLTRRKRVSHAIEAVRSVNRRGVGPVTLDVYGDGESRGALERRVADDPVIRLRGHDPRARERLTEASFVLLTAHSEGFPLTLIEAMEAGCLPIAYDVEYGPADVIRHGRNGYLVRSGDVEGLAAAIHALLLLPERDLRAMRSRAIRSTREFGDGRVTHRWAVLLDSASVRRDLHRSTRLPRARAAVRSSPLAHRMASTAVDVVIHLRRMPR